MPQPIIGAALRAVAERLRDRSAPRPATAPLDYGAVAHAWGEFWARRTAGMTPEQRTAEEARWVALSRGSASD